jgi:hypothetical protein
MNNSNYGFYFRKLRVIGENMTPANLTFTKGFNVISGLSDTGKSYAFSCIDFVLGSADPPKELPESKDYSKVQLEIGTNSGIIFTLERSLEGGDITKWDSSIENDFAFENKIILKPEHNSTNENNISSFMLGITGLGTKKIKKDRYNTLRNLSFRDIAKLVLVDEERIITEKSPAYVSRQHINQTQEQSIFNILLGANDDSNLTKIDKPEIKKSKVHARSELLTRLIAETNENIDSIKKELNEFGVESSQSLEDQLKNEVEKNIKSY